MPVPAVAFDPERDVVQRGHGHAQLGGEYPLEVGDGMGIPVRDVDFEQAEVGEASEVLQETSSLLMNKCIRVRRNEIFF